MAGKNTLFASDTGNKTIDFDLRWCHVDCVAGAFKRIVPTSQDFESHRPPSTPAPTTPALPTPLRPPPLRPPAVPAPYHTGPLRYRPPTETILCEYSDCMYTQLLKLRYWISSPVKMIHVQYPKVNSITKKYFLEMNDRLQNLSILLHFRKIKYIDSKESWWTILYLIVWYEPLSCRWHSYAWPK